MNIKGFHYFNEAWYGPKTRYPKDIEHEIMVGIYDHPNGGTDGEFAIRWHKLGKNDLSLRVEIFYDAMKIIDKFLDLLLMIKERGNLNPQEIMAWMVENGYKDLTERKRR